MIKSSEEIDHLSLIRYDAEFEFIHEKYSSYADRMFIEVQPGHVQLSAGKPIEPGERDQLRAETLRKEFLRMPQLNLDPQVD